MTFEMPPGPSDALRSALAGRYALVRELGRGGMAAVYLAHDTRHDRPVAVKVLDRRLGPSGVQRFLHEIRIAARLTHPHIVGLHDSGEADGQLYYVMPYVEGETLRSRVAREGPLPVVDVIRILRELADALACAHERGVVHRDLKPENILLAAGHALVADFGIAKALSAATEDGAAAFTGLTSAGLTVGTPGYMAPEQAVGAAIDHRADLYALGMIAWEMLAGAHPFAGRTAQALVAAQITETPPDLRGRRTEVPGGLAVLVTQLLAKDPALRPRSAAEVVRTLETAGEPAAVSRRRMLVPALMVFLALLLGGFAWWRTTRGEPAPGVDRQVAAQPVRTVAVLPFVNIGGGADDEYFSDGMTDELAHALARVPGLRLAGRTSSYAYKGTSVPVQEIGRALQVEAIVNGTVRRSGNRLRVTTQLVSTLDGKVLRDSIFESQSGDVFTLQDEFTRAIVTAFAPVLGERPGVVRADAGRGTSDQEAYDLYLKARYHWLARGQDNVSRSITYFRQAIARDPGFARAHAGLAFAYGVLPSYIANASDSTIRLMTVSAERAVELDSTLVDGQVALGMVLDQQHRFPEAESRYRAAIAREPSNVFAHHLLGFLLMITGRTGEAVAVLQRAEQLDPLAKSVGTAAAGALTFSRQFPEAMATARRILALDSTFPLALLALGQAQVFGGQPDSAVRTLERLAGWHSGAPGHRSLLVLAYAAAGRWAEAERIRREFGPGASESSVEAAFAELVFGNRDPLVRLLITETGRRRWYVTHMGFGCNPLIDPLWEDPRFPAAMRSLAIEPCPLARPWPLPPRVP
jgi:TolB-like protein/tetratricopeptide (TPR) repeat protein